MITIIDEFLVCLRDLAVKKLWSILVIGGIQMDKDPKILTSFNAKFKTIIARSGDGIASLDFVAESDATVQVIPLLQVLDASFELVVDELKMAAGVGYLKFDGKGRTYVRLTADVRDVVRDLQAKVERVVALEVMVK